MSIVSDRISAARIGRPRKGEEEQRRLQLLSHAVRLFAEQGYGKLSLETIAREARVSLRTIYQQFGGKAELFAAVVRHYSDLFVAALPADPGTDRDVEALLVDFGREFLFQLTRENLLRLRAQFMAEAPRFPELAAEFYGLGPRRTLAHLARFFALQQRSGRIAPIDPDFLAEQFLAALRGERFQRLEMGLEPAPDGDEIDAWARAAVRLFLRGCWNPSG